MCFFWISTSLYNLPKLTKIIFSPPFFAHNHLIHCNLRTVSSIPLKQNYLNSAFSGGSIKHPQVPKSPSDKKMNFSHFGKNGRGPTAPGDVQKVQVQATSIHIVIIQLSMYPPLIICWSDALTTLPAHKTVKLYFGRHQEMILVKLFSKMCLRHLTCPVVFFYWFKPY